MVWPISFPPRCQTVSTDDGSDSTSSCSAEASSLTTFTEDYDDESSFQQPPPAAAGATALSWRLDPIYSFSDWRIQVLSKDRNTTETFYVHRTVLAFGPRRSGYFEHLFHFAIGNESPVTTLELNDRAAAVFGDLLDYVYSSRSFALCTNNAVALSFLAQCLMVPELQTDVDTFIRADLGLSNVGTYMSQAIYFQDSATSCRVVDKCVEEALQALVSATSQVSPSRSMMALEERHQPVWKFLTRFPKVVLERVRRKRPASP
jgi:hypothetical protein